MNAIIISGLSADKAGDGLIALGTSWGIPFKYYEWNAPNITIPPGDLCFAGHSIGVDTCLEIIRSLNISINRCRYFAMIDGVDGGKSKTTWNWKNNFYLPVNVEKADCFTRDWHFWNFIPPSSQIVNADGVEWINYPPIKWAKHETMPSQDLVVRSSKLVVKGMLL